MGKGGYSGGSTVVGWGAHGFAGRGSVTSQKKGGGKPGFRVKKSPKTKLKPIEIDLAALPESDDVRRAAKRVLAVQSDMEKAKKRLSDLECQLVIAIDKFKISENLAGATNQGRRPAKARPRAPKK